jgi:hypothetical protein
MLLEAKDRGKPISLSPSVTSEAHLWPNHRSFLQSQGLDHAAIARGEFRSVGSDEARAIIAPDCDDPPAIAPGIVISYRDHAGRPLGYVRVVVGPKKTLSPRGVFSAPPYIPFHSRGAIDDNSQPLIIVVGELVAARISSRGYPCIGMPFASAWSAVRGDPGGDEDTPENSIAGSISIDFADEWRCLRKRWRGRTVLLCSREKFLIDELPEVLYRNGATDVRVFDLTLLEEMR